MEEWLPNGGANKFHGRGPSCKNGTKP